MSVKYPQTPATLQDVARAAGVSTATVSRCLNASPEVSGQVSPQTRSKVMRAVEALGYTPNFGARAMAAKRTYTIGAIIPTMENAIFARGLQAFQEALHDRGYTLLVSSTGYDPDREAEQVRALAARGADGLLLIGYARAPETYAFLERRRLPVLVSWAYRADGALPCVGFDNARAMAALTREVLAQGHRDIAVICGLTEGNDRAADRLAGVRAAVAEAGRDGGGLPVLEAPYEIDAGAQAFGALMATRPRPTAVLCVNDVLAVGAMQEARRMNLDVPRDISITGFDDIELARVVTPGLTTLHVPHRDMGTQAAHTLIDLVERPQSAARQASTARALPVSLKMRGSLGPPPAAG